jgi:hypothetical protein
MSYRDDVRQTIEKLLEEMPPKEGKIDREIRKMYAKALEEAKQTGASVESMTYEVLEGIGEGLSQAPELIEPTLQRASLLISDLLHHSAIEDIAKKEKRLAFARDALNETIEAEKIHLVESLEALRNYAHEHNYREFQKSLHLTSSHIMKNVLKLAGEIMYNHKQQ